MPPRKRPQAVLLQILIQDPAVLSGTAGLAPIHPVVAKVQSGFGEGPVCARVAIVDIDSKTGDLRPPATFDPAPSTYRGVSAYRVHAPSTKGVGGFPWAGRREDRVPVAELLRPDYDDPFLKVSVFGTVIRTIAFVEHPLVLGRPAKWAFSGPQLLVVPRAGDLDNAFYHRDSRSLQFFSFPSRTHPDRIIHAALSQEIVTHETAHALIDGVAPDLYAATDPESLAIHEAVADLTAVMMGLRNRELHKTDRPTLSSLAAELTRSSRFSQIAEEFGSGRGDGQALRDALNVLTLDETKAGGGPAVDRSSPHSLSQILTGAFYSVLAHTIGDQRAGKPEILAGEPERQYRGAKDDLLRPTIIAAIHRVGGMLYRGLDWLPPGEVSLAAYVRAVIAADRFHQPDREAARDLLVSECAKRGIDTTEGLMAIQPPPALDLGPLSGRQLPRLEDARRLVGAKRDALGLPQRSALKVTMTTMPRVDQALIYPNLDEGEIVDFDRRYRIDAGAPHVTLVKVAWWSVVPLDIGERYGRKAEVRRGLCLAVDDQGAVIAVIRGSEADGEATGRTPFLRRMAASGALAAPDETLGPDGRPRVGVIGTTSSRRGLRVDAGFAALHIAG